MEIIQQRLEGEANLDLVQTAPNVTYRDSHQRPANCSKSTIRSRCPTPDLIEEFRQPIVRVNFVLPTEVHRAGDAALAPTAAAFT